MFLNKIKDYIIGRKIALICHFSHNGLVGIIIIIIMIMPDVKEPVPFKTEWLMNL
jgi:hypothetical protein